MKGGGWLRLSVALAISTSMLQGPVAQASCAAAALHVRPDVARSGQSIHVSGFDICNDQPEGCSHPRKGDPVQVRLIVQGRTFALGSVRPVENGDGHDVRLPEGVSGKGVITVTGKSGLSLRAPITVSRP